MTPAYGQYGPQDPRTPAVADLADLGGFGAGAPPPQGAGGLDPSTTFGPGQQRPMGAPVMGLGQMGGGAAAAVPEDNSSLLATLGLIDADDIMNPEPRNVTEGLLYQTALKALQQNAFKADQQHSQAEMASIQSKAQLSETLELLKAARAGKRDVGKAADTGWQHGDRFGRTHVRGSAAETPRAREYRMKQIAEYDRQIAGLQSGVFGQREVAKVAGKQARAMKTQSVEANKDIEVQAAGVVVQAREKQRDAAKQAELAQEKEDRYAFFDVGMDVWKLDKENALRDLNMAQKTLNTLHGKKPPTHPDALEVYIAELKAATQDVLETETAYGEVDARSPARQKLAERGKGTPTKLTGPPEAIAAARKILGREPTQAEVDKLIAAKK